MSPSRREFFRGVAGAAALGVIPAMESVTAEAKESASPQAILALFKSLSGDVAVKIHAPATNRKPEFLVESNAAKVLFVGSAFKSFVLCDALRQADSPDVGKTIASQQQSYGAEKKDCACCNRQFAFHSRSPKMSESRCVKYEARERVFLHVSTNVPKKLDHGAPGVRCWFAQRNSFAEYDCS